MGKWFYWVVIGVCCLFIGMSMFPSMRSIFNNTSTTGFSDFLKSIMSSFPYILGFFIGYAAYKSFKGNG